ncbi:S4 domain-containing protein, partial [Nocardioides sp. SOB44]
MPPRRLRLDAELVRRGLARAREHASERVAQGRVKVSGAVASKPATGVTTDVAILVTEVDGV